MPKNDYRIKYLTCVKVSKSECIPDLPHFAKSKIPRLPILVKKLESVGGFLLFGRVFCEGITVISAKLFVLNARGIR
jgi:hypothetical protein